MAGRNTNKDKSMAADLKKRGTTRGSGRCPRGCGAVIANGGGPLVAHLGNCKGRPKERP